MSMTLLVHDLEKQTALKTGPNKKKTEHYRVCSCLQDRLAAAQVTAEITVVFQSGLRVSGSATATYARGRALFASRLSLNRAFGVAGMLYYSRFKNTGTKRFARTIKFHSRSVTCCPTCFKRCLEVTCGHGIVVIKRLICYLITLGEMMRQTVRSRAASCLVAFVKITCEPQLGDWPRPSGVE